MFKYIKYIFRLIFIIIQVLHLFLITTITTTNFTPFYISNADYLLFPIIYTFLHFKSLFILLNILIHLHNIFPPQHNLTFVYIFYNLYKLRNNPFRHL